MSLGVYAEFKELWDRFDDGTVKGLCYYVEEAKDVYPASVFPFAVDFLLTPSKEEVEEHGLVVATNIARNTWRRALAYAVTYEAGLAKKKRTRERQEAMAAKRHRANNEQAN